MKRSVLNLNYWFGKDVRLYLGDYFYVDYVDYDDPFIIHHAHSIKQLNARYSEYPVKKGYLRLVKWLCRYFRASISCAYHARQWERYEILSWITIETGRNC